MQFDPEACYSMCLFSLPAFTMLPCIRTLYIQWHASTHMHMNTCATSPNTHQTCFLIYRRYPSCINAKGLKVSQGQSSRAGKDHIFYKCYNSSYEFIRLDHIHAYKVQSMTAVNPLK